MDSLCGTGTSELANVVGVELSLAPKKPQKVETKVTAVDWVRRLQFPGCADIVSNAGGNSLKTITSCSYSATSTFQVQEYGEFYLRSDHSCVVCTQFVLS